MKVHRYVESFDTFKKCSFSIFSKEHAENIWNQIPIHKLTGILDALQ